ncbi:MAG TPA: cupin domain-containing protein [Casimicrobiaceae bacterium]|jgi:quercetin dioxygenase-like cupin family protein
MKQWLVVLVFSAAVAVAATGSASPPTGVIPTLLSRGTYPAFNLDQAHESGVDFQARAKAPFDIVVRKHDYAPHAQTGWHTHPGPVFITVLQGSVTFYERDDPSCTPKVVRAGEGYVDDGHGHLGVNESNEPAVDVSVILAPVGTTFRGELSAPAPACKF